MFKFRVNRKNWARGGTNGQGILRDEDGKMCCLGFLARESGYRAKKITFAGMPDDLVEDFSKSKLPPGLIKKTLYGTSNTTTCRRIASCNDDREIQDTVREERLIKLFKKIGIEVEFYG